MSLSREQILNWLREEDKRRLEELWQMADETREAFVGSQVHLRGLVEISNHCVRRCGYCGLRAPHAELQRYRLTAEEILGAAHQAVAFGYGTVVLQAGEDPQLHGEWVAEIVRQIKRKTPLAVTLSLGERKNIELLMWKRAGADRYLLRFETSDPKLFRLIHPPHGRRPCERIELLKTIKEMGYEAGSGVMIGIPGQSYASLADDILLFKRLNLDMIGVGPWLAHPQTPLGRGQWAQPLPAGDQVPSNELMVYKTIALARIVCPEANIPSTTALATINRDNGRELGLARGANVVMPNLTPVQYRALYEIYPAKACVQETGDACDKCIKHRIQSMGRDIGAGPGGRQVSAVADAPSEALVSSGKHG